MINFSDLYAVYPELEAYIVDGTDRPYERAKDNKTQELYYSGKKKRHTMKNQVFINPHSKKIIYATDTLHPDQFMTKPQLTKTASFIILLPRQSGMGD